MNYYNDINNSEKAYVNQLEKVYATDKLKGNNKEIILKYVRDSELGKTIIKGQKKKIGKLRIVKTIGLLLLFNDWLKKDFKEVTVKDMEDLILKLDSGKIKSNRGTPFASETLMTIKKFIRKFWKWLKGQNKRYPKEVEWIDTTGESADIHALPRLKDDIIKMCDNVSGYLKKSIIITLFDSGCRIAEFLNIRIKDVQQDDDGFYYINIRYSKTFERLVSLPIASNLLRKWLDEHPDKNNPQSLLFPVRKPFVANLIKRIANKELNRHVTCHMLRHTSATYYASRLDRANFCNRFGWSFSSKMPDRYIDKAKINQKKVIKAIKEDEITEVKKDNRELKEKVMILSERLSFLEKLEEERKQYDDLMNKLFNNSEFRKRIEQIITKVKQI